MSRLLKIVLLISFFGSLSCEGRIVIPPLLDRPERVLEGYEAYLICKTRKDMFYSGETTVGWHYQHDKTKDTTKDPGIYIVGDKDNSKCGKKVEAVGNNMESWCLDLKPSYTNLFVKNLQRKDSGIFTCVETYVDHPGKKNYAGYDVQVTYLDKPVVIADTGRILEGGKYTLKCQSEGFPVGNYQMYFNGKNIDSLLETDLKGSNVSFNSTSGVLTIGKFSSKNVGDYVCVVDNDYFQKESDKIRLDFSVFTNLTIVGILVGSLIMLGVLTGWL